jgi:hypothetical protein
MKGFAVSPAFPHVVLRETESAIISFERRRLKRDSVYFAVVNNQQDNTTVFSHKSLSLSLSLCVRSGCIK